MEKRIIRHGAFEIHLNHEGRLVCYRITLPISKDMDELVYNSFTQKIKGKYYYIREFVDFDEMQEHLLALQLMVTDWKLRLLDARRERLLGNLSEVTNKRIDPLTNNLNYN